MEEMSFVRMATYRGKWTPEKVKKSDNTTIISGILWHGQALYMVLAETIKEGEKGRRIPALTLKQITEDFLGETNILKIFLNEFYNRNQNSNFSGRELLSVFNSPYRVQNQTERGSHGKNS